jgi:hypothetical protein
MNLSAFETAKQSRAAIFNQMYLHPWMAAAVLDQKRCE